MSDASAASMASSSGRLSFGIAPKLVTSTASFGTVGKGARSEQTAVSDAVVVGVAGVEATGVEVEGVVEADVEVDTGIDTETEVADVDLVSDWPILQPASTTSDAPMKAPAIFRCAFFQAV